MVFTARVSSPLGISVCVVGPYLFEVVGKIRYISAIGVVVDILKVVTIMRSYRKPLQDLWFCEFEERLIGVNTVKVYGRPEKHRLTVSATSGFIRSWGAGLSLDYDRYITNFDRKFKPKEGMMVFVDIKPVLDGDGNLEAFIEYQKDADGNLVIDEDGDNVMLSIKYETSPDYMIKNILDTQKGHVARYGIKKV